MTGAEIMAAVGFIVMLIGFLFGLWKYIDSKIGSAKTEASVKAEAATSLASLTRQELSEYKLHVAETYVTKAGMSEQTGQIMRALEAIGGRLDGITERIDSLMQPKSRART